MSITVFPLMLMELSELRLMGKYQSGIYQCYNYFFIDNTLDDFKVKLIIV